MIGGRGRERFEDLTAGASDRYQTPSSDPDTPAQLYYTSGTTGLAKGILHAHRYLLAHEEFQFRHDVKVGELFYSTGEWAWIAGIVPACSDRGGLESRRWFTAAQVRSSPAWRFD